MIHDLPDNEHFAIYVHSGKVWLISSKGKMVQPLPVDVAEAAGIEIFRAARKLRRRPD